MKQLVLIRHGESEWNRLNLFTGWTDVELTDKGLAEAHEAGRQLKAAGFDFDLAYTSYQGHSHIGCPSDGVRPVLAASP